MGEGAVGNPRLYHIVVTNVAVLVKSLFAVVL